MPIKLNSTGGGSVSIDVPSTASTYTIKAPAENGNLITTGATSRVIPAAALPTGCVIQVQVNTLDGVLSGGTAGAPSTITNGVQIFSLNFTPLSASSLILVQTSTIALSEEANSGDRVWLALWRGGNFIAANSGSPLYSHFAGNLNMSCLSLNNSFASWGTTMDTISVRGGIDAGTIIINGCGNALYNYTGSSSRIQMTVWEIAQ
jgi:hypothetical protein